MNMKQKIAITTITIVVSFTVIKLAHAFDYYPNKPLVFTYKAKGFAGGWSACGPVQCLWAGEKSESAAIDYVTHTSHGYLEKIGTYGRCIVYQGDGKLETYDNQPEVLVNKTMKKKC